ncbi:hypothetical protein [Candidatus Poriferisodalis sp.]|uniref:Nmad2 family putative nucleotide modification protein n=1 Tax=Candidatus Poriferisodalis sp. TaxID=3101277 RepID=UPI003D11EF44
MGGLYTYVMPYDIGFAPNPYHGACTLATCKPGIRRTAQPGDWVVGIGSKQRCRKNLMIYAMRVQEILSYDEYWESPRFARKKPFRAGSLKQRYGDNVYHHTIDGREWVQEDSRHSLDGGTPNPKHLKRDTSAPQVLVSTSFAYYGDQAIEIPVQFRVWDGKEILNTGPGYRRNFPAELRAEFIAWLELRANVGIAGEPADWPRDV